MDLGFTRIPSECLNDMTRMQGQCYLFFVLNSGILEAWIDTCASLSRTTHMPGASTVSLDLGTDEPVGI